MALEDLLNLSNNRKKIGLSEERIKAIIPIARQYIAYFREYPDMFADFLQTGGDPNKEMKFKFYFYQRIFVRVATRYKYVYMTFPRAYSKSLLSMLVLILRCILYPRAKLFVTSGGKEQSASICKEKVGEWCQFIPALEKEFKKKTETRDYCKYEFKNDSYFDNIPAKESSRGRRRHGGLMEEAAGIDGTILNEVIIPVMNVSRQCLDGTTQEQETLNKSQIYITTAGMKNTFPYNKLIQILIQMVIYPEKAFIMGGTWRIKTGVRLKRREHFSKMGLLIQANGGREKTLSRAKPQKRKVQRLGMMSVIPQGGERYHSKRVACTKNLC